jgi:hypothetical protein
MTAPAARLRLGVLLVALALACAGRKPREPVRPGGPGGGQDATSEERGVPPSGERPRVPASPRALLAPGAVAELQRALRERGLLRGHQPGELDRPTSAALRRFQQEEDLPDTGMPDRETLRRLGVDPEKAYRGGR